MHSLRVAARSADPAGTGAAIGRLVADATTNLAAPSPHLDRPCRPSEIPAAILPLTFAERYRCAPDLAAGITFASVIAMVATFPLMYSMLM